MQLEKTSIAAYEAGQGHFLMFGSYGETLLTPTAYWGRETNAAFWRGFYQERQDLAQLMEINNGKA